LVFETISTLFDNKNEDIENLQLAIKLLSQILERSVGRCLTDNELAIKLQNSSSCIGQIEDLIICENKNVSDASLKFLDTFYGISDDNLDDIEIESKWTQDPFSVTLNNNDMQ
jgi:hypothetical protein